MFKKHSLFTKIKLEKKLLYNIFRVMPFIWVFCLIFGVCFDINCASDKNYRKASTSFIWLSIDWPVIVLISGYAILFIFGLMHQQINREFCCHK